jgi:hypothetical protein
LRNLAKRARADPENTPGHAAIAFQPSGKNKPEGFELKLDTKRKLFCSSSQPENALNQSLSASSGLMLVTMGPGRTDP